MPGPDEDLCPCYRDNQLLCPVHGPLAGDDARAALNDEVMKLAALIDEEERRAELAHAPFSTLLAEFHELIGQPVGTVTIDDDERLYFRLRVMTEEWRELKDAIVQPDRTTTTPENRDPLELLDAMADLVYTVFGTAVALGYDLDGAVREVHRSNMTKTPTGRSEVRGVTAESKGASKGPDFSPPDLTPFLPRAKCDCGYVLGGDRGTGCGGPELCECDDCGCS